MEFNSIKSLSKGPKFYKKLSAIVLSIIIILGSYVALNNASRQALDTIDVVRVSMKDGIPAQALISKEMIERYAITKREFTNDMITYEKFNSVINNYSIYYMRNKTVVYKDQVSSVKPLKNEWLYALQKENEVLTIPYNYLECGGDILTPGDVVRMRINTDNTEAIPSGGFPDANSQQGGTAILFDSIRVRDLLNSKGHSIYEVYKEVLKLNEEKKQEVMKSREFLDNILPKSLVLEGTNAQVNNYAKVKNKRDVSFTITILSRINNKNIMDQLPTIAKEVESWIPPQK